MRHRYKQAPDGKMLPIGEWNRKYGSQSNRAHHVMPDIEPYTAVAGDMAGKTITSRKQHREFLRRNNLTEVGNEKDYMTRNGGMADDNPNLMSEKQYEEKVCQDLIQNLNRMKNN